MQSYNVQFKISNSKKPVGILLTAENEYVATKMAINHIENIIKFPVTFKHVQTTEVK